MSSFWEQLAVGFIVIADDLLPPDLLQEGLLFPSIFHLWFQNTDITALWANRKIVKQKVDKSANFPMILSLTTIRSLWNPVLHPTQQLWRIQMSISSICALQMLPQYVPDGREGRHKSSRKQRMPSEGDCGEKDEEIWEVTTHLNLASN